MDIRFFAYLIALAAAISGAVLADPSPAQDFCVADLASGVKVNGFPCKDPANVTAADFYTDSISKYVTPTNAFGVATSTAFVGQILGINTLGISLARADFAPNALVPPHHHPRATEIIFVLEGALNVSFITTANKVYTHTVEEGGVFVFPRGLVHFLKNIRDAPASIVAAFDSQLPGTLVWPLTLFGAQPQVSDDVLATSFQISTEEVQKIRAGLFPS